MLNNLIPESLPSNGSIEGFNQGKARRLLSQSVSQSVSLNTPNSFLPIIYFLAISFIISIFLTIPSISLAEDLKEVTVEGIAIIGEDTTKAEARVIALNNARRNAIEEASGVLVKSETLVSDYSIIFDLIKASSRGLIVQEEIISEDKKIIKDKTPEGKIIIHETNAIKLKALVKPINQNRSFRIKKLTLHKAGKDEALNLPVFTNNEEAQIKVKVSEDSYIHIFSISQDGAVTKLLPSKYFPKRFLKANEELIFPDTTQRDMGLRLKVQAPAGLRKAVESLVVIVTKGGDEEFLQDVQSPNLIDLWQELSQIDSSAWADEMVGYEIRR